MLINVKPGKTSAVAKALSRMFQVRAGHPCWGKPDIFPSVETDTQKVLSDFVLTQVHSLDGGESTDTHLVIES